MPKQGRLGDNALCPADTHGCPACPHLTQGPAVTGSSNVTVNGRSALRVGDQGVHSACCAANTWTAVTGSSSVLINGKPAHRAADRVQHCGGIGALIQGSENVWVGDAVGGSGTAAASPARVIIRVQSKKGKPVRGATVRLEGSSWYCAKTDATGEAFFKEVKEENYKVTATKRNASITKATISATKGLSYLALDSHSTRTIHVLVNNFERRPVFLDLPGEPIEKSRKKLISNGKAVFRRIKLSWRYVMIWFSVPGYVPRSIRCNLKEADRRGRITVHIPMSRTGIPNEKKGPWLIPSLGGIEYTKGQGPLPIPHPDVVSIGDSLIAGHNEDLAMKLRPSGGAFVAAVGTASLSHYIKPIIKPPGLRPLKEYLDNYKPRVTVLSVGSNDARLMSQTSSSELPYTIEDYRGSLREAIRQALRSPGHAVVLVNVADHWEVEFSAHVQKINKEIELARQDYRSRNRIFRVDWFNISKVQDNWFKDKHDIHFRENALGESIGRERYYKEIAKKVHAAFSALEQQQ